MISHMNQHIEEEYIKIVKIIYSFIDYAIDGSMNQVGDQVASASTLNICMFEGSGLLVFPRSPEQTL